MQSFWWAMTAASIWGIVPLLEKLGLAKAEPLAGLFYRCLGVVIGLLFLIAGMVKPAQIKAVGWSSALYLIAGGFLASFVAQVAFYSALKSGEMSRVVPISGSYPFLTFILGVTLLGESFSPAKLAGAALVVAGIWVLKLG